MNKNIINYNYFVESQSLHMPLTGTQYLLMMMLMRHMIYSKVPYLLFLMNTSPSTLKTFLVVGKVNLGLLLGCLLLFAGNDAYTEKNRSIWLHN